MGFETDKRRAVNNLRAAESTQDLDMDILGLLNAINDLDGYYTTSSCMGRVALLEDLGGKGLDNSLVKWHRKVTKEEVIEFLSSFDGSGIVWLKLECPILHIIAKDEVSASKMLDIARNCGFKRSGVQSLKPERYVIEVLSTERIEAPIRQADRWLVSEDYLGYLVEKSNERFDIFMSKLLRFEAEIKKLVFGQVNQATVT